MIVKHNIEKVAEFHRIFGHPVAAHLTSGDQALRRLRVELIAEELRELAEALGVPLRCEVMGDRHDCLPDHCVDLVGVADALGDIEYVTLGAQLAFGVPGVVVLDEIHASNMSKLDADGKPVYRADGKIIKSGLYRKPNLLPLLRGAPGTFIYASTK